MTLRIIPLNLNEANALVAQWHRHHRPVKGCKFCIGVADGERVVGAAIVGRPVARGFDDGFTLEVNRLVTDGTRNACSKLLGAVKRAYRPLGFERVITYTLPQEGGSSLRAAGFRIVHATKGGSWNCPSRPRVETSLTSQKLLWEVA